MNLGTIWHHKMLGCVLQPSRFQRLDAISGKRQVNIAARDGKVLHVELPSWNSDGEHINGCWSSNRNVDVAQAHVSSAGSNRPVKSRQAGR